MLSFLYIWLFVFNFIFYIKKKDIQEEDLFMAIESIPAPLYNSFLDKIHKLPLGTPASKDWLLLLIIDSPFIFVFINKL